ncbi:hypothetical protein JYU16_01085 [bacterium AH-315-M05]|nr:hypothetical protein [bacterium AH-315-M05]
MPNNLKVLFLDPTHPHLQEELEKLNYQCDTCTGSNEKEIISIIHNYHGIVIRSRIKLDRTVLDKASKLKFIARAGAGMENIDVAYATSKGIKCINAPEGNKDSVAEHAMGMLLSLFNNIIKADNEVRKGLWNREKNRGIELAGKTVGIIGYGYTGRAFAKRLKDFEVNINAYDKYKKGFSDDYATETSLETIFEQTDVLSLHIPLTDETHYMVNDEFINKFKKNIYLINTSRGKVVKTDDLVRNIKSGKILGACLDVLEHESTSFEELKGVGFWYNKRGVWWNKLVTWLYKIGLWKYAHSIEYLTRSERVIFSPHIAGWTVESREKIARILAEKIKMLD